MGNNSCSADVIQMKLHVPSCVMELHICFKFYKIHISGYLVMASFIDFQ